MVAATTKYVAQGRRDARHTGLRLARQTGFRCLAARPSTSNAVRIDFISDVRATDEINNGTANAAMPACARYEIQDMDVLSTRHNQTNPTYLGPPVRARNHPAANTFIANAPGNVSGLAICPNVLSVAVASSTAKIQKRRLGSDRLVRPHRSPGRAARFRQNSPFRKAITTRQFSSVPSNNVEWFDPFITCFFAPLICWTK
jgi:hypothetical protein